jgi:two-component system sensor histidine kinase CiaH
MDRFWKQFAASGTASRHNVFLRARLKLTALYVVIIAIIIFGFSLFLYRSIEHNLNYADDDDFVGVESHHHFVANTLPSVENDLILADISILVIAAGLSFVIAGKTLKPIQLSVEAQKAFAANASHELRTPLAVMRNDIEVHLRNNSPTRELAEKTMSSNLEEIKRMSGIVEDLLLLARSDNHIIPKHTAVDMVAVVKNVLQRITPLAESKKIELVYTSIDEAMINGDRTQLERVVLNILQNSIDHTPENGSITVEMKKEKSHIALAIIDTGFGIPTKDLPHIFTRFYKGNSATGIGLGLPIVKGIVTEHRGDISVESTEGQGTKVLIGFEAT